MPVPLVERNEDTLGVGRAFTDWCQPRPVVQMFLDIGRGVVIADFRQAGAAGLEPPQGSPIGRLCRLVRICRVRGVLAYTSQVCALGVRVRLTDVRLFCISQALVGLTRVRRPTSYLASVCRAVLGCALLPCVWGARIFLVNVSMLSAFLGAVCMASLCLARIRLVSFCLAGFWLIRLPVARGPLVHDLSHGDGVLGARARLRARADFIYTVAGVSRVAASRQVTAIGLVPAATQFGHA